MNTVLQLRTGDTVSNPDTEQLREALSRLSPGSTPGYDTWLSAKIGDSDWYITAHEGGSLSLTIVDYSTGTGEYKIYELPNVSRAHIIEVWKELQRGDIDAIMGRSWQRTT